MRESYTVVYDGDCRMCTRIANVVRNWADGGIEVLPSQSPSVRQRFHWITEAQFQESLQVVRSDGATWQGAGAVEELLGVLPRGRLIAWIFHVPFVRAVAERAYRWIARNRYRLGCGDHCSYRA